MSQALYRKYRPSRFDEVFGQKHVVQTIQNQIADDNVAHAYLFAGPRGIGKTTIARLLAKTVNCEDRVGKSEACGKCKHCEAFDQNSALDIVEIDAASNTGVDNVRENIIEAIRFAPTSGEFKVFIIDEVHMLSASAFNALLKTLEEPPAYGIFILATTELHKIPQTIVSRCQRFDFHRLTETEIVKRLNLILTSENIKADDSVLKTIAKLSEGCLRDAESLLSQIMALGEKDITEDLASIVLPRTNVQTVENILSACEQSDASNAIKELQNFVEQGGSVKRLNDDLIEECRIKMMENLASDSTKVSWFRSSLEIFLKARSTPAPEIIPHLPLEMAIIEICGTGNLESGIGNVESGISNKILPLPKGEIEGVAVESNRIENSEPRKQPKVLSERSESKGTQNPDEGPEQIEVESDEIVLTESEPQVQESNLEEENAASSAVFNIENIASKWKRCCEEVAKTSIALPLALKDAQFIEINSEGLVLGFDRQFHVDSVSQRKNTDMITDAIERVMQHKISIVVKHISQKEKEVPLQNLAEAFGGAVVE